MFSWRVVARSVASREGGERGAVGSTRPQRRTRGEIGSLAVLARRI